MTNENQQIAQQIDLWLQKFIIELDICPFARIPYQKGLIRLAVAPSDHLSFEEQLFFFDQEAKRLAAGPLTELSTSLLIFPHAPADFIEFLDFSAAAEEVLKDISLDQEFQVVVFHPHFYFAESSPNERGNWVNRSPYPLLHLLRQSELDQLTSRGIDGTEISLLNQQKLTQMNEDEWASLLLQVYDDLN